MALVWTHILSLNPDPLQWDVRGAHITHAGDLLYLSPTTQRMPEAPIRGGVPLIGPRFGVLLGAEYPEEPNHGSLRRNEWTIIDPSPTSMQARLYHAGVDYTLHANLVEQQLSLVLGAINVSSQPVRLQVGFHPYFAVPDVCDVVVDLPPGAQVANFRGDRSYADCEGTRLTFDEQGCDLGVRGLRKLSATSMSTGHCIEVEATGADTFVVWNPGVEQAAGMGDLPDDAWRDFLCLEPMIHGEGEEGIVLEPEQTVTLSMTARLVAPAQPE